MAMREVKLDESEQGGGKTYKKFEAIGDSFAGVYIGRKTVTGGPYGDKDEYTFRNKEGDFVITPPTDLSRKLGKASLAPGFKVIITYTSSLPPTKEGHSPMKLFKVLVDDEVKGIPAKATPAADLDDIAF